MSASCSHLDSIQVTELPHRIAGCEECLASGGWWVHLRMCQSCGHTGCCDSSPNRHASAHARDTGHPIVRSTESGEDWSYCYLDDIAFVLNRQRRGVRRPAEVLLGLGSSTESFPPSATLSPIPSGWLKQTNRAVNEEFRHRPGSWSGSTRRHARVFHRRDGSPEPRR